MKTISIIGGTGMLGAPVAKALQEHGYKVRIITRNKTAAVKQLGDSFEYREANLQNVSELKEALAGSAGIHINASGHSKQSYFENHVIGTRNILKAIEGGPVQCISMISTASAYPEFADRWDNKYKMEAEALIKESGIPYLVFMPSWFMETLPLFIQKNKLMHIGPSTKDIHWITAQDYAKAVALAYQNEGVRNERIPLYGPEGITMAEAMNRFATHHKLSVQKLPVWLAKIIGRLSRDETLVDVADLMQHYDRTGEKHIPDVLRTTTTFNTWLTSSSLSN
jgi:uncharacterized protein YbjT (DUF2867 family)